MTASCAGYGAFIRTLLRERICNTTDKGTEFTMFKKLDSVMLHYEDVERELSSPDIASDQKRFRSLTMLQMPTYMQDIITGAIIIIAVIIQKIGKR